MTVLSERTTFPSQPNPRAVSSFHQSLTFERHWLSAMTIAACLLTLCFHLNLTFQSTFLLFIYSLALKMVRDPITIEYISSFVLNNSLHTATKQIYSYKSFEQCYAKCIKFSIICQWYVIFSCIYAYIKCKKKKKNVHIK